MLSHPNHGDSTVSLNHTENVQVRIIPQSNGKYVKIFPENKNSPATILYQ